MHLFWTLLLVSNSICQASRCHPGGCGRRCQNLCSEGVSCGGNRDCRSGDCKKGVCVDKLFTSTHSVSPGIQATTTTINSMTTSATYSTQSQSAPTSVSGKQWELQSIRAIENFGSMERDAYGSMNRAYVDDPLANFGKVLQVRYPAKSYKPSATPVGGTGFYVKPVNLSESSAVTLEYDLLFPAGFNFVKGGKLPGLYGGHSSCSGGNAAKDCFSTRFMFRALGAGELYIYADQSKQLPSLCIIPPLTVCNPKFGISAGRGSFSFATGQWNKMTQRITLNTPGKNDGSFEVWVNNKLAMSYNQMFWRSSNKTKFIGIDFQTFFGGGDSSWATPTDQFTFYKNFKLLFN